MASVEASSTTITFRERELTFFNTDPIRSASLYVGIIIQMFFLLTMVLIISSLNQLYFFIDCSRPL